MADRLAEKFRQAVSLLEDLKSQVNDRSMSEEARANRDNLLVLIDEISLDSEDFEDEYND
jgi:hypothetical protein